MNTNTNSTIATICQIFAQKQGGSKVPLNRKNDTKSFGDGLTTSQTDKNSDISVIKRHGREEGSFDDTLRKKMKDQVPDRANEQKSRKDKEPAPKEYIEGAQNQSVQEDQVNVNQQQQEDTLQFNTIDVEGNTDAKTVQQTDKSASIVETTNQDISLNGAMETDTESPVEKSAISEILETTNSETRSQTVPSGQTQTIPQPAEQPESPVQGDVQSNSPETVKQAEVFSGEELTKQKEQHVIKKEPLRLKNDISPTDLKTSFVPRQETPAVKDENPDKIRLPRIMTNSENQGTVSKAKTSIHRMNVSMEQIESIKAEKQPQIPEKSDIKADFKPDLNVDKQLSPEINITQPVAEKAPSVQRPVEVTINENSKLDVARQIQESVKTTYSQGNQQIVIRLDPPDLGRVTIRFTENQDGITGTLNVEKVDTKYEIQQALPSILQNLQNSDIQIRKMEVVLNNQQQQHDNTAGDFANPNEHFQQQGSLDQNTSQADSSFEQRSSNKDAFKAADSMMEFSDKSINMLI